MTVRTKNSNEKTLIKLTLGSGLKVNDSTTELDILHKHDNSGGGVCLGQSAQTLAFARKYFTNQRL